MTLAQPAAGTHRDPIHVVARHVGRADVRLALPRLIVAAYLGVLAVAVIMGAWLPVLVLVAGAVLVAQAYAARMSYVDAKAARGR